MFRPIPYAYFAHMRVGYPIRIMGSRYAYGQYFLTHTGIAGYPCFAHMSISARTRMGMAAHTRKT